MSLLPLLVVLALVVAVAIGAALTRREPPSLETAVSAARQHAAIAGRAAVALGVAAALLTAAARPTLAGGLGVSILVSPVVFGIVHTAVLALGEFTWPRPAGSVRRARLVHRGLFDAVPRWLLLLAAGSAAVAAITITAGAVLAGPDGRSFTWPLHPSPGESAQTASPFPGWFYGRPAAVGLLALLVVALLTLRVVATRAAVTTDDERAEVALRRASGHRVLRGVTAVLLVDTGGLVHITGTAMPDDAPLRALGIALAALGAAAVLAGVVVGCVRAPDVPAAVPAPAVPGPR